MGFIQLKCPSCGADIQLDSSREFGFCSYCGTKMVQEKQVIEHRVINDHSAEIEGYLTLALRHWEKGDVDLSEMYYEKVLALDPNNKYALQGLARCDRVVRSDNFYIKRLNATIESSFKFHIKIDGSVVAKLDPGQACTMALPIGKHTVQVVGYQKSSVVEFEITNNREVVCFTAKNGFGKAKIERA